MATGLLIRRDLRDKLPWEMGEFSLAATFNNDGERDAYYATHYSELINDAGTNTYIASAGKFQMWTGANAPSAYDKTLWQEVSSFMEGQAGPTGPQGVAGPAGPQGPEGPEGPAGDITNLFDASVKEGDVLTVDGSNMLVPTGVTAREGSVTIATNTLNFGDAHSVSSGGENVFFRNLATGLDYSPAWIEVSETGVPKGTVRMYSDSVPSTYTSGSARDTTLTNPEKTLTGTKNRRLWSVTVAPVNTIANVRLEVKQNGNVVWDHAIGDATANTPLTADFQGITAPIDNKVGEDFHVRFYSPDGDVQLSGSNADQTPYMVFKQRLWEDVELLTNHDKMKDVVALPDHKLEFEFNDGTKKTTDVKGWFNGGHQPPSDSHTIWYGFSRNRPPIETDIKAGTSQDVRTIGGLSLTAARGGSSLSKYVFLWVPTVLGDASHIDAGGLHDTWQDWPVTVNGVAGKVYVSDNPTYAKNYRFKVGTLYVY